VVVFATPLKFMTELDTKLVPLTVRVNCVLPTVVDIGLIEVVVGTGFRTVKIWLFDVPPPGAPFTTVTAAVVATVRSEVSIEAARVVVETKVVVLAKPFHRTEEEALKFVPVSVSAKPLLPAVVDVGEMEVKVGTGLLIVSVCEFDVPPPGVGLMAVMDAVAPAAMSLAKIVAVSREPDTKVVMRLAPFICTDEFDTKLVPLTVKVKLAPPAVVDVGDMKVVVGTGFETATALLNAEVIPAEVAQIFMLSPKEYCIAVYVKTPAVTAAPLAGVDVIVPLPAVPPHTWVESTGEMETVVVLSPVSVFPN